MASRPSCDIVTINLSEKRVVVMIVAMPPMSCVEVRVRAGNVVCGGAMFGRLRAGTRRVGVCPAEWRMFGDLWRSGEEMLMWI